MSFFNFSKKDNRNAGPDFSDVDSNEKAIELAKENVLAPLYIMPLRFGGEKVLHNTLFVPPFVVELKERYDDMVQDLLEQGKVSSYNCTPQYKGKSFIPSSITITASGTTTFTETINIW